MKAIITLIIIGAIVYFLVINPPEAAAGNESYIYFKDLVTNQQTYNQLGNTLFLGVTQMTGAINTNNTICGVDISVLALAAGVPSSVDLYNAMKALIYKESSGNCQAYAGVSGTNSMSSIGLCQLTAPVVEEFGYTMQQALNAGVNVYIGTQYYIQMLQAENWDIKNAYARYNGGGNPSATAWQDADEFMTIYNNFKMTGNWADAYGNLFQPINCNC
jgi:hypothetical protein